MNVLSVNVPVLKNFAASNKRNYSNLKPLANDTVSFTAKKKSNDEKISELCTLYELKMDDIKKLMKQGFTYEDIKMIVEAPEHDEDLQEILGTSNVLLQDMIEKKDCVSAVMKILKTEKKSKKYYTVLDAYKDAKIVKFDIKKINKAYESIKKVNSKYFGINDALILSLKDKDYSIEEIQDAAELQKIIHVRINVILQLAEKYGIEKIAQRTAALYNCCMSINCSLPDLLEYSDEEFEKITAFIKENKVPFDEACAYLKAADNPAKTSEDDVFPKELTDEELIQKYQDGTPFRNKIIDMYCQIRRTGDYAVNYGSENYSGKYGDLYRAIHKDPFDLFADDEAEGIEAFEYSGGYWTGHRLSGTEAREMPDERISLNVKGSADLIKKLDILMQETNGAFEYKTFSSPAKWGKREDPVTMYFYDKISDELFDKIAEITEPYARGRINGADENSKTPWMAKEQYTHGEIVDKLLERAENLNSEIYQNLKKDSAGRNMSTGQYRAYVRIMDEYERYLKITGQ